MTREIFAEGVIRHSKKRGYHISDSSGRAYALRSSDLDRVVREYSAGDPQYVVGNSVQFVPSGRRSRSGLPVAGNVIVPLDSALKTKEHITRTKSSTFWNGQPKFESNRDFD